MIALKIFVHLLFAIYFFSNAGYGIVRFENGAECIAVNTTKGVVVPRHCIEFFLDEQGNTRHHKVILDDITVTDSKPRDDVIKIEPFCEKTERDQIVSIAMFSPARKEFVTAYGKVLDLPSLVKTANGRYYYFVPIKIVHKNKNFKLEKGASGSPVFYNGKFYGIVSAFDRTSNIVYISTALNSSLCD